jgi:hypothetical protein
MVAPLAEVVSPNPELRNENRFSIPIAYSNWFSRKWACFEKTDTEIESFG